MRLEKISFYNINSLKGEHTITFDEGALADAGLFAITGPTGSGKSTILDVITLALYNYVPRLGKISKTNIEKMGSIVTHFTDEAWAEVEYTAHNKRFLSKWSISKNRNDKFREYEMDLIALPEGKSEGLKKSEIPARNTEIIGLTYDQFLKSILLSQGEFSKFLKANKDDRSKLLEEITGTHIYREIGKLAFEKIKDKKIAVDIIGTRMETIQLLTDEAIAEINEQISALIKQNDLDQASLSKMDELLVLFNQRDQISARKKSIEEKENQLTKFKDQAEEDLILLERHNQAKQYEQSIQDLDFGKVNINRLQLEIEKQETLHGEAEKRKESIIQNLANLIHSNVEEVSFYEKMAAFEKEIIDYDTELHALSQNGSQLRTRIGELCAKESLKIATQIGAKIPAEQAISIIDARLKSFHVSGDINPQELQEKWTTLQSKKSNLTDYIRVYEQSDKLRKKIKLEEVKQSQFEEAFTKSKSLWISLKEQEEKQEEVVSKIKKAFEQAKSEADLEGHRSLLEEGEACPLCGSTTHPYAEHRELAEIGILSLELDKSIKDLEQIRASLVQAQTNQIRFENTLKSSTETIEVDRKYLEESEELRQEKINEHSWILNIADGEWQNAQDNLNEESKKIKHHLDTIEEIRFLENIRGDFTLLVHVTNEYKSKLKHRNSRFSEKSISRVTNDLQNQFTGIVEQIEQNLKSISAKKDEIISFQEKIKISKRELIPLQEKYELEQLEDCKQLLLSLESYRRIKASVEQIQNLEVEIKTLHDENAKVQLDFNQRLEQSNLVDEAELRNHSIESLKVNRETVKSRISSIQKEQGAFQNRLSSNKSEMERYALLKKELDILEKENKSWILLNQLIGDAKGKKFSNYAQDLTLIHLLTRANARLESLTDRYFLSFRSDEDDLIVIDKYQGDTERAVKTLSGGESFLISLALALSLSDFASQKVKLESLFIDEGFGTLDHETLDIAMSTLEKLQHESGKRIGIISHVASLKERINTQIRVKKDAQGYSRIELVSA